MSAIRSLSLAALLLAGSGGPAVSPFDHFDTRDVQIALHVRKELMREPTLAGLNIGVSVRRGEATLWGPVPTWDLADRALKIAGKVKGVYFVRNDLRIEAGSTQEALQGLTGGLADGGIQRDLLPTVELPPASHAGRSTLLPEPPLDGKPQVVINAQPSRPLPEAGSPSATPTVFLLPPRPLVVEDARPAPAPPIGLPAEVDRLRQGDDRFRGLHFDINEGVVVLTGRVDDAEDLMELARGIARLAGVVRVDLHAVRTSR